MNFILSQLVDFVGERQARRNLGALLKYLIFLAMSASEGALKGPTLEFWKTPGGA